MTNARSALVGVAETGGINTYAKHVCWRRRDRGGIDRVRLRESVNSREVRHSLTWHSSKSESALERFEPVAVAML